MRIAVIGAGAMGSIYGGHLAGKHHVYLVDTNQNLVNQINSKGLTLSENDGEHIFHPEAVTNTAGLEPVDLIILFVKSLFSKAALSSSSNLIGPDTYILTLQNGSGHENILSGFVPPERIIIGTTEDNGAVISPAHVRHGGSGKTNIGMLEEDHGGFLPLLKEALDSCGFEAQIHTNIQQLIWNKLFTNVSLSVLTAVLQVPMGYIAADEHAWTLARQLIHEAVLTAHALGLEADEVKITEKVRQTSISSPEGITSICADIRNGRKTEVNTISGSVVQAAHKCGVAVPTHEIMVEMIHALENRKVD